ncbi:MAG TPA: S41 family peptidase [Gemmatimonadaceae bacterium]|nr:S41 family peptidase [Gemmatimonadaceae bacterium]
MPGLSRNAMAVMAAALFFAVSATAQPSLTPVVRTSVMDSVIASVTRYYVDADTANLIAKALRARVSAHAYDAITNPAQLADVVTRDLRSVNGDLHLSLSYTPPGTVSPTAPARLPDEQRMRNFGMGKAEVLDGNIGYLEITGFVGGQYQDAVVDALRFLSRTDALIIDLRRNGGGASEMSHFIFSHFLDAKAMPTIMVRTRRSPDPQQRTSFENVPGPRRTDVPLYILTSQGTASAAEEFTFVLHNQHRATTVGSRTAGAGHMVNGFPVGNGFTVSLSITRVSDPVTGKEWERVGVPADIDVAPERALDAAYAAALKKVIAHAGDSPRAGQLNRLLETAEARSRAVRVDAATLAKFAGTYDGGRTVSVRDGQLWYTRRAGAMPDVMVPLGGNKFALGAARFEFAEVSGKMTMTVGQPDGTALTLNRQ